MRRKLDPFLEFQHDVIEAIVDALDGQTVC